jgi:uncharacterized protein YfaS (alpha-2-macroglobulin family)
LLPASDVAAGGNGLSVRSHYMVTADDPSQADAVASGDNVDVSVDLTLTTQYPYAMLEEPIPAGSEVADPGDDDNASDVYSRREVRDDKIVWFFDTLPVGVTTANYELHAETPGTYRILPGIGSLVYHPELRGNTGLARLNIKE